jgi:DNA ligase D-like protein (predicted 3'-phosphoesterase)
VRFVVQQHDATRLHYDLRLEVDGVLRSWAVPRGPSPNPRDRRLAVPVPDHTLAHGEFEGVLPEPHTGSGAVIIWDEGTYAPLDPAPMAEALAAGHAAVRLEGHKLRGGWALTRTAPDRWILVKMRDAFADEALDLVRARPESVRSGRTVAELAGAG